MLFRDGIHEENYNRYLQEDKTKETDVYRKSLFYLLSCCDTTRRLIHKLYDFETHLISDEGLKDPTQTSGSIALCRLAFNLYNSFSGLDGESSGACTPDNIFYVDEFRPYMIEAIKIRYDYIE